MTIKDVIQVDADVLGGTPVFRGTRVAVKTLFDHLEVSSLDDFLAGYPSVSREQAETAIEWASNLMIQVLQQYESAA